MKNKSHRDSLSLDKLHKYIKLCKSVLRTNNYQVVPTEFATPTILLTECSYGAEKTSSSDYF